MFSTLGRALPIEIRVNVNARRPRLKAARAPFESDKRTIKLCLNFASGAFDFKYNYVWSWPKCCPTAGVDRSRKAPVQRAQHGCLGRRHPTPRFGGSTETSPPPPTPPLGPEAFFIVIPYSRRVVRCMKEPLLGLESRTRQKARGRVSQAWQTSSPCRQWTKTLERK